MAVEEQSSVAIPTIEERDWRYRRVREEMRREDLAALIVYGPAWRRENVRYLAGTPLTSHLALVVFPLEGAAAAFVSSLEDMATARRGFIDDVRELEPRDLRDVAARLRRDARGSMVGIAGAEFVPYAIWKQLEELLPSTRFVNASPLMERVRLVKSDWEIEQLRYGGTICDAAWAAFVEACIPGAREFEIVAGAETRLRERGAEDNFMLIASGGVEVRGMSPPSDRRIEKGDMVRTELTPQWNGYWTQICRTAVVGLPSAQQRASFELFDDAVAAGLEVIRPGVTAHEVARAQNDVFRARGYGEYCTSEYTRVRGHGLGLHVDEVPILEGVETVLEKNAVVIVHPNTFTPLAGYHVLGDPVVVTERGAERLIATPRELNIAPA